MSLISASHDSLPYIEPAPTSTEASYIASLLAAELPADFTTTPHPLLPPSDPAPLSPAPTATTAIDLSRYDSSETLTSAYTSTAHLSTRLTNLSLLSTFGKNAWVIHNSQLEQLLRSLEEQLMSLRTEAEVVNKERKGMQVDVEEEMRRLEERWKRAVGRVLEVEVATEEVRRVGLERQRRG